MSEQIGYTIEEDVLSFSIDESIFPLDAIFGAAYLFVDRCFLFFSRSGDKSLLVHVKKKSEKGPSLEELVGEFGNELLNEVLRFRLAQSTSKIREYYMARAFMSHPAQSSIDSLLAELDAEELEEDDLEISVPWEQGDV